MRRSREKDEFEVRDVAARLLPYEFSQQEPANHDEQIADELMEKALTLLGFMPRNQSREKFERLLSPNDPVRGHRAVDALVEASLATVDARGRLQRIV
jgi:hypothetical protein